MLFFRLFRKVDPSCAYCRHGTRIGERDVVCLKRGVVPVEHHCRAFRYDPLKRTPPRPALLRLGGLGEEDFLLDAVPGQETLFAGMDAAASGREMDVRTPETEGETAEKLAETLEMPQDWKAAEPLKISEDWEAAEETEPPEALEGTESIEEPEEAEEPETPQEVPEPSEEAAESGEPEKRPMKVKVRAVKIRR